VSAGPAVVSDAGPLIVLAKLNVLHLLKALYGCVHVAQSVYDEVVVEGMRAGHEDAKAVHLFLAQTHWPIDQLSSEEIPPDLVKAPLDRGERDSLALALRLGSRLILIDETVGREVARDHGLAVRGSLGVLIQAYRQGEMDADRLRLYLAEVARRHDIWINPALVERLRDEVLGP
jgi:predicted nucleic acid-binding protein